MDMGEIVENLGASPESLTVQIVNERWVVRASWEERHRASQMNGKLKMKGY